MNGLGTDGRAPELLQTGLVWWRGGIGLGSGLIGASLDDGLAGVGSLLAEGIEETETGSERHDGCLFGVIDWLKVEREVALAKKERFAAAFRRYQTRCRNAEQERSLCQRLPFPRKCLPCLSRIRRSATATFDCRESRGWKQLNTRLNPHIQSCRSSNPSPRRSRSCASTTAKPRNPAPPSGKPPSFRRPSFRCATDSLTLDHSSFLTQQYPAMKKANPHTPILIREALEVEPRVWARYG